MRFLISTILFTFFTTITAQVNFTTSNLPIITIQTNGAQIQDEPKIKADMGIIYNGPGVINKISDVPNDYKGNIGIELRGSTSQSFPKKPYGFETWDESGEDNDVKLLGMPKESDWTLNATYNDKTLMRDGLSYILAGSVEAASELLFVGDAGTTEASRPSRCHGLEWTNLYVLRDWLALDADLSSSQARFSDPSVDGDHIPGAVTAAANLGITVDRLGPWFGAFPFRYFGPRTLIEDNSVRSKASALTNLRVGYKLDKSASLALDVYNLFDRKANDIEYWYASQLPGEISAQFDRHVHPTEPRSVRVTLQYRF